MKMAEMTESSVIWYNWYAFLFSELFEIDETCEKT